MPVKRLLPIGKIAKIKYFVKKEEGKIILKLLFSGAVFLVSLLVVENPVMSSGSKANVNDTSLFSTDVSFSQEDYKKENCTTLAEDNLNQDIDEGTVAAVNNYTVVSEVEKEQSISGQDYVNSASEGDNRRKKSVEYYVKEGDTLSTVASKFGIKMQTLLWANNLDALDVIQPGDRLAIPPEDGAMYRVEVGDTLLSVANRYDCDINEIVEYNQLDANVIVEGQLLFLPGGEKPEPVPSSSLASNDDSSSSESDYSSSSYLSSESSFSTPTVRYGGGSHGFPYGYCTWYVAQRRGGVPWGGNASAWLSNASAAGYATGYTPVPGAIMVTRESWWGHVAYVESVSGGSVRISEMNYNGWGVVSSRSLPKNSWKIRGYIY